MKKKQKGGLPSIERSWERGELTLTKQEKAALIQARAKLGISMNEIVRRALVQYLCHKTPEIAIRAGWIGRAGEMVEDGMIGAVR